MSSRTNLQKLSLFSAGPVLLFLTGLVLSLAGCRSSDDPASGTITPWAGDGTQGFDGDGLDRTVSWFNQPLEMAFGPDGLGYIVDWNNHRIRRVKADDTLETLVGGDLPGDWPCQNPADPANCDVPLSGSVPGISLSLNHPNDILFTPGGLAVLAAWHNHKAYDYDPSTGFVTVIGGQQLPGFTGDGGPAAAARLNFPDSLAMDAAGNLFVADERNNRVRRIANNADRVITTVAGSSLPPTASGYAGDDGPAVSARLALTAYNEAGGSDNPPPGGGLAMGGDGTLYIADTFNHCIRKIVPGADGVIGDGDTAEEIISTVAGSCGQTNFGYTGDGGQATAAALSGPHDLDFGPDGHLFLTDTGNHVIRAIDLSTGIITTVAGTGTAGFSGDGGPATEARLSSPYGIAFDSEGNLYIVDTLNNRIRKVLR